MKCVIDNQVDDEMTFRRSNAHIWSDTYADRIPSRYSVPLDNRRGAGCRWSSAVDSRSAWPRGRRTSALLLEVLEQLDRNAGPDTSQTRDRLDPRIRRRKWL